MKTHRDRANRNAARNGRSYCLGPGSHKGWGKRYVAKANRRAGKNAITRALKEAK